MLFKRPTSSYWYYKFTVKGKVVYRSTGTSDKEKAQEIADKTKAATHDVIKLGNKQRYLWQDAVLKWVSDSEKRSIDTDKYHLKWLRTYLDGVYLDDINEDLIEKIIKAKLKVAGKTRVNRTTELIRSILNKAMKEWKWIDATPHIRRFKEGNHRLRWLTQEEAARLIEELPEHTKAMALFTLATGLRESNVTHLEWTQVDMQRKIAWIHADQAKAGKVIRVPLNQDAIDILVGQIGKHQTRVFTYCGRPVDKVGTHYWREALKRADIENFTWHGLRHTWASWHVQAGTPLNVLQELGGWSSYDMVLRYAHLAPDHLSDYANNVSLKSMRPSASSPMLRLLSA
ncbi:MULTISPECIES: tyrosine-type recombinase/integrase [Methylomonas]|uniref:Integrase n=2 Tax=Methylomonas TaxID=416 RepID=A0A140E4S8_9GAMM|nr:MULTISPECIES: site-specific integrase [Methylomonas]AMK75402.1 integrase [Methylomonas denitrificans]OAI01190.1 integrase [Methylomonas methanica]TCV78096.1 site-specific recombinase XerD [Methylomonas methanica]